MSELSGLYPLAVLLECAGLARSSYYYAASHPKPPTRPELWEAVAEIFSRTANGCGHRQIAMCLRAERGVRIADKTVLKMMREKRALVNLDSKLANLTFFYFIAVFIHNFYLPAVTCFSDTADFMYILYTEMYTTRSDGFRQTIVGIILMIGEDALPLFDQTLGNGLCTDVHQTPLIQLIIFQIYFAAFDGF